MNLTSFILYNLSNIILIILLPESQSKEFLNFYSLGSGIFSFAIFYFFSKKIFFLSIKTLVILTVLFILISLKISNLPVLIFVYVFLLLFSDYYFSQSNLLKMNFLFKTLLLITSFFLYINISLPDVLLIKIILIIIFLSFSKIFNISIKKLKVKSPTIYSAYTCGIYFGALFLTSILAEEYIVKIFYICLQIFLGFKLKFFDLKIRGIKYQFVELDKYYNYISIFFFFILSIYLNEFIFFLIFLISNFTLEYVRKKYIL